MKKLTAGIFSVLVGLCAANSADAAIASKAWVEQDFVAKTTYTTDQAAVTTAIADAKKAGTDANAALETYKTSNNAAVALKADKTALDATNALVGTLPEGATATTIVGYIDAKTEGIATDAALGELQTKVNTNTTNIGLNTTAIATLNGSGDGSVAKSISDALASYTNTEGVEAKIKVVSEALEAHETAAANTYQTKAAMTNTAVTGTAAESVYPTVALMNTTISNTQSNLNQAVAEVSAAAVKNASDITALTTTVGNNKTAAETATKEVADALAAYKTSNDNAVGVNTAAIAAINNETNGILAQAKAYAKEQADAASGSASGVASDLEEYIESNDAAVALKADKTSLDATDAKVTTLEGTVGDSTKGLVKAAVDNANAAKAAADAAAANALLISANSKAIADEEARATAAEQANAAAAKAADDKAVAAQATANAAIPKPTGVCENAANKCVLTYNNSVYTWEVIERATGETGF